MKTVVLLLVVFHLNGDVDSFALQPGGDLHDCRAIGRTINARAKEHDFTIRLVRWRCRAFAPPPNV